MMKKNVDEYNKVSYMNALVLWWLCLRMNSGQARILQP